MKALSPTTYVGNGHKPADLEARVLAHTERVQAELRAHGYQQQPTPRQRRRHDKPAEVASLVSSPEIEE